MLLRVKSVAGPEGLQNKLLFVCFGGLGFFTFFEGVWSGFGDLVVVFFSFFSRSPPRRAAVSGSQRRDGTGRRRSRKGAMPAEQEREAPSPESRPLCPPPPGPCLGQNMTQSSYCLLGKGYGILLQLFMKENI